MLKRSNGEWFHIEHNISAIKGQWTVGEIIRLVAENLSVTCPVDGQRSGIVLNIHPIRDPLVVW